MSIGDELRKTVYYTPDEEIWALTAAAADEIDRISGIADRLAEHLEGLLLAVEENEPMLACPGCFQALNEWYHADL